MSKKRTSTLSQKKFYMQADFWINLICFLVVIFILLQPLMSTDAIFGHDGRYHVLRIESLKNQILMGEPFSKINSTFMNNAGYASSMCYPDIFLYIPALLTVAGLPIGLSFNLFLMLTALLCFIITFICAKKICKNSSAAMICATVFSLSQYHLDNLFARSAIGEIQIYIFIPLLVYGLYDLLYEDFKHPWVLGVSFAGMVLSHTISTFLAVLVCFFIVLFNIKKLLKTPKKIVKLLITAGLTVLATAFYWAPLIELMIKMDLTVAHPTRLVNMYDVKFSTLFRDVELLDDKAGMGAIMFLLLIPRFFIFKKKYVVATTDRNGKPMELNAASKEKLRLLSIIKAADCFVITGIVTSVCATSLFPWDLMTGVPGISSIQFPWRLYLPASVLLSFGCAMYLYVLLHKSEAFKAMVIIVTVLMSFTALLHIDTIDPGYVERGEDYYKDVSQTGIVGAGEWLPYVSKQADRLELLTTNAVQVKTDTNKYIDFERNHTTVKFDVDNTQSTITYADAPLIYYIGYEAELTDENGNSSSLAISGEGENGMCRVEIPKGAKGTVTVHYAGTTIQNISYITSICAIAVIIALIILKVVKKIKLSQAVSEAKIGD